MTRSFFKRYDGTPWHRFKLLIRGIVGIIFCIPLAFMTGFYVLLEIGNRTMDIILCGEQRK